MRLKRNQVRLIPKSDNARNEIAEYGDVWRVVEEPKPWPGKPLAWRLHPVGGYSVSHRIWVRVENDPDFELYRGDEDFRPIRGKGEFRMNVTRQGREPADDLKKRLVAICEDAGLTAKARMILGGDARVIYVEAHTPEWPNPTFSQITLLASIGTNGDWDGKIKVGAPAPLPGDDIFRVATLDRPRVSLAELPIALTETLEQQQLVIDARLSKKRGPWVFGEAEWKRRLM